MSYEEEDTTHQDHISLGICRQKIYLILPHETQVPSGGVTLKRRCTYRPSVIYLIVNKRLSLSLAAGPKP